METENRVPPNHRKGIILIEKKGSFHVNRIFSESEIIVTTSLSIDITPGQRDLADLVKLGGYLRDMGKKIALCHGVFDLLHIGHIRHFKEASLYADVLMVTVTPDRFVNKGPHRPSFPEALRAEAIDTLSCVDYVAINQSPTSVEVINLLKPHVYLKGPDYRNMADDYTGGIIKEIEAVEAFGGKIIITDDITFSSSRLLNEHFPTFSIEIYNFLSSYKERKKELLLSLNEVSDRVPFTFLWESDKVTYKNQSAPYFGNKPKSEVSIKLPFSTDAKVAVLFASAYVYLSDSGEADPDTVSVVKFLDHLLK
jgi:cytidyltransferase-like protein